MLALDVNGGGNVVHDFPRVAPVGLQQERLGIAAAALARAVAEDALGAVIHHIGGVIARQRLGKLLVVRWKVSIVVDGARIRQMG